MKTFDEVKSEYPDNTIVFCIGLENGTYSDVGCSVVESCYDAKLVSGQTFRAEVICFKVSSELGSDGVSYPLILDEQGSEKYLCLTEDKPILAWS